MNFDEWVLSETSIKFKNFLIRMNFEDKYITINPNIKFDKNGNLENSHELSRNKFITFLDIESNWVALSFNSGIKILVIINNPELPWIWKIVSLRNDLTIEHVNKNWDYAPLSRTIPIKDILANDKPWNWRVISSCCTINDVLNNPGKPWNWIVLTENEKISVKDILSNLHLPWVFERMHFKKDLTLDLVFRFDSEDWNWFMLSLCCKIKYRDVLDNPNRPWNWKFLTKNKYITFNDISSDPDKDWDWDILSKTLELKFLISK